MSKRMFGAVAILAAACLAVAFGDLTPALAGLGEPTDGQLGLQLPASPIMQEISDLFNVINIVIVVIALFVLALMVWVIYRYSEKNNPNPSRITHHTGLEVAWTILPILILVGISIPSFHLLFNQYSFPKPDLTIKATGNAWFWEHEYLDQKVTVTSNMVNDEDVLRAKIGDDDYDKKYGSLEGAALHEALFQELAAAMGGEPPATAPDGRSGNRRADQQGRARAGHVERRHSLLDGSVIGREDAGCSGPHVGSLVQGHASSARSAVNARFYAASSILRCRSWFASSSSRSTTPGWRHCRPRTGRRRSKF